MSGIQRAKCDNCGFKQEHIFVHGMHGIMMHLKYSCLKCKKIITYKGEIDNCPKCGTELIKLYKENFEDEYHTCPKCGKRKLKFYLEAFT